jgi:hypothetical protein
MGKRSSIFLEDENFAIILLRNTGDGQWFSDFFLVRPIFSSGKILRTTNFLKLGLRVPPHKLFPILYICLTLSNCLTRTTVSETLVMAKSLETINGSQ